MERAEAFETLVVGALDIRGSGAQIAAAYRALSDALLRSEEAGPPSGPSGEEPEHTISSWALVFALRTFHVARELLVAFPAPDGQVVEVGAGIGPFGLAASLEMPRPTMLVDLSRAALERARKVYAAAGLDPPRTLCADGREVAPEQPTIIAAPFSLWEMTRRESDSVRRAADLVTSWARHLSDGGRLYLLEAGTRKSARFLQELRDALAGRLNILGPCTGAPACPLLSDTRDWCHFTWRQPLGPIGQRVAARAHRKSHELHVSWLVLGSGASGTSTQSRVLEVKPVGKHEARARLCSAEGLVTLSALRRNRAAHERLLDLVPGNLVELDRAATSPRATGIQLTTPDGLTKSTGLLGKR